MNKFLQYIKFLIETGFACPSGFEDDMKFNYQHPKEIDELLDDSVE